MMAAPKTSVWSATDGILTDERIPFRHGFTTRALGSMKADARRREAADRLGLEEPLTLKQVHGTRVLPAPAGNAGAEADGWVIDRLGVSAAVYTADCVPLFLWTDSLIGVFHAGWRGVAAGMPEAGVKALAAAGAKPSELKASIGPCIGPCCFRVGPELEQRFPESSKRRAGGELFVDLPADVRRRLLEAGLRPESVGAPAPCTMSNPDSFFSFRRDKQDARMLAVASLEPR